MKKYFLFMLLLSSAQLFSQNNLGIATYTIPEGWQSTSQASSVILENNNIKGNACRITIYDTENAVVKTESDYLQHRASKNGKNVRFITRQRQIVRKEADGLIGFFSFGTATVNEKEVRVYFYSFTNGKQTFFIELLTSSNNCTTEFNQFLTTLLIDPAPESSSGNNVRRKKAAPSPAPAAPAPMM